MKEILLLVAERSRGTDELAQELSVDHRVVARAIENLMGLGLIEIDVRGEADVAALTDLGREVAEQQSGG